MTPRRGLSPSKVWRDELPEQSTAVRPSEFSLDFGAYAEKIEAYHRAVQERCRVYVQQRREQDVERPKRTLIVVLGGQACMVQTINNRVAIKTLSRTNTIRGGRG